MLRRHRLATALVAALAATALLLPTDALAAAAAKKKAAAAAAEKDDAVLVCVGDGFAGWMRRRRRGGRDGVASTPAIGRIGPARCPSLLPPNTDTHTRSHNQTCTQVTCGSAVKLTHTTHGARLHSHEVAYGSGSGQQSVTGARSDADAGSVWLVKPAPSAPCEPGAVLKNGAVVRLQHAATRRWLHSHHFPSPLSRGQEVSAFGGDGASDHLDEWTLDLDRATPVWKADAPVRFKHVETGVWLTSSGRAYGHPIAGHVEVVGLADKKGVEWTAGEGVYVVGKE